VAKKLAGALILALGLSASALATPPSPVVAATPPQPAWSALSQEQRATLAPLAGEWDRMENYRRKKWLGIAQRYRTMGPEEQQRLQQKMHEWARLTPEQRLAAREKFKEFNQMSAEEKAARKQKWQEYSQLPEEERRRVRTPETPASALAPTTPPAAAEQQR
jgi:hypothetical protein